MVSLLAAQNVSIPLDSLPANMQAQYRTQQTLDRVNQTAATTVAVAENAEDIGIAVGSAMREGLGALTEEANKFADTKVGIFTACIIGWKVLGEDVKQLTSGIMFIVVTGPVALFFFMMWVWSFRRLVSLTKVPTETTDKDGKITKSFELKSPEDIGLISNCDVSAITHMCVLVLGVFTYFVWCWNALF